MSDKINNCTTTERTVSLNSQGIYCAPGYNSRHHKGKLMKMLRLGYNAYGYGGFHCYTCKAHSPMPHEPNCANGPAEPTTNKPTP